MEVAIIMKNVPDKVRIIDTVAGTQKFVDLWSYEDWVHYVDSRSGRTSIENE